MKKTSFFAATVFSVMAAGTAHSAVTVIGSGFARSCYEAAEFKRNLGGAVVECSRALDEEALTRRDRAATYVNRGIVHMYHKDLTDAVADFDKAIGVKPDIGEAYVNKAIALVHLGNNDQRAIELLSQGLELKTSRPEVAFYTRGVANELAGNIEEAYADYRQAAALKPGWDKPKAELARFKVVEK